MYILTEAHQLVITDTLALIAFGMARFRNRARHAGSPSD
jgi:hypothetical protein